MRQEKTHDAFCYFSDDISFLLFLLTRLTCRSKSPLFNNSANTNCKYVGTVQERKLNLSLYSIIKDCGKTIYPIRNDEDTVLEKVFIYITLSLKECENSVSSVFRDTENSDSKSSSIIYREPFSAHLKYSCRFEAVAVTPLG